MVYGIIRASERADDAGGAARLRRPTHPTSGAAMTTSQAAMPMESALQRSSLLLTRYWRIPFVIMLALLHLASLRGGADAWARALMLAHFGFFITWQPFMRSEQRITPAQTGVIAVVAICVLFYFNWWLLGLWVSVLAGIVGGKVFLFRSPWLRRFYLVVFTYLVALLLLWVVPGMVGAVLPSGVESAVGYGLPVLFLVLLAVPAEPDSAETPQIVDFFYATMLFLLLVVLVLGAFAFMQVGRIDYVTALLLSLFILAGVLVTLSLVWNPRAGFQGLSMYFSRYLLSIGMPFEQWLFILAELSQVESKPDRFMKEAIGGLARLPWVAGGYWKSGQESGEFGTITKNTVEYSNQELHLRVFASEKLSPSLIWHFHLLGQLLGEFYVAKLREQKLQQQTYIQAVHETGARMTHDMKNLLQSLNVLCAAADDAHLADTNELTALIRRQLPAIAQRLQHTVDKLRKPQADTTRMVPARDWWQDLRGMYHDRGIDFQTGDIPHAAMLPKEMLDTAADNLLQNALRKRKLDAAIEITASVDCSNGLLFTVCDSGSPIAPELLRGLLREPVQSQGGFGIGLYQTTRMAELAGFTLRVTHNEPGRVCFGLSGPLSAGSGEESDAPQGQKGAAAG
jgi:signal transduction histidine kinase